MRIGSVPAEAGESALRTLLAQAAPCEVLHLRGGLRDAAARLLYDPAATWTVTALAKEDTVAPAAADGVLRARQELQVAAQAAAALGEAQRPPEALAALCTLLGHVKRLHLLAALGGGLTVRARACMRWAAQRGATASQGPASSMQHRARMQVVPYASGASHMRLDGVTLANLEVVAAQDGSRDGTLLQALDRCVSHAGKRTLRAWLCRPLQDVAAILGRQRAVQALAEAPAVLDELRGAMAAHPDLARCDSVSAVASLREAWQEAFLSSRRYCALFDCPDRLQERRSLDHGGGAVAQRAAGASAAAH